MIRLPSVDCLMCSFARPVLHTSDTSSRHAFTPSAVSLPVSAAAAVLGTRPAVCLATVLEVLLRAGFVASMPGTPEFCPRKDTPQVVHCDDGRISTRGKSLPIFSH